MTQTSMWWQVAASVFCPGCGKSANFYGAELATVAELACPNCGVVISTAEIKPSRKRQNDDAS